MTVTAFQLAETYRQPVVLLLDAVLSHMRENIDLPQAEQVQAAAATVPRDGHRPFGDTPFVPFGEGERTVVTGLAHDESGLPRTGTGAATERILRQTMQRLETDRDAITRYETHNTADARYLVLAYGITARAALAAVEILRDEGIPAGLLELQTLWPFPDHLVAQEAQRVAGILVPELNLGQ
ncbi:Pyruvate flavodoxin/ferredoxin oxidoreductase, thiamine diP-binding domain protein, partial [mine drainage metagenome]